MIFEKILIGLIVGLFAGILSSMVLKSSTFNMVIHTISGILGAVITSYIVPEINIIRPVILEILVRSVFGAFAMIFAISLLRKV